MNGLAKIKADPRVHDAYRDSDGYWVWLRCGWRAEPGEHGIHEDTIGDVLKKFSNIEPCSCEQCGDLV